MAMWMHRPDRVNVQLVTFLAMTSPPGVVPMSPWNNRSVLAPASYSKRANRSGDDKPDGAVEMHLYGRAGAFGRVRIVRGGFADDAVEKAACHIRIVDDVSRDAIVRLVELHLAGRQNIHDGQKQNGTGRHGYRKFHEGHAPAGAMRKMRVSFHHPSHL